MPMIIVPGMIPQAEPVSDSWVSSRKPIIPSPIPAATVPATPARVSILLISRAPRKALSVSGRKLKPDCMAE
ncbi:hypothetical protein D3C79_1090290 [compost metagenome]